MRDLFKLAASVVAMVAILIGYSVFLSQTSAPAQAVQSTADADQCCANPADVADSPAVFTGFDCDCEQRLEDVEASVAGLVGRVQTLELGLDGVQNVDAVGRILALEQAMDIVLKEHKKLAESIPVSKPVEVSPPAPVAKVAAPKAIVRTSNYKPGEKKNGHWSFVEPTIWDELRNRHGIPEDQLPSTEEEAMTLHDRLHVAEKGGTVVSSSVVRSNPVRNYERSYSVQSSCPGGVCPPREYTPRTGFRLFRR